jgi:predicted HTH domain antitoxin
MTPKIVTFEVSPDLLAALKVGTNDLGRNIRLMAAIAYFQEKKLSLGKASQLAGMNRLSFMDTLVEQGITPFDYDESMLEGELDGIAAFPDPA